MLNFWQNLVRSFGALRNDRVLLSLELFFGKRLSFGLLLMALIYFWF